MFAGHYAAALAAKAVEPRAPLWTLVGAAQLVDIGWGALVLAGVEHGSVDPALPGSALVLEHMPWTHSLPAAIVWSLGALLLARFLLRLPMGAAIAIGAVVFSHWLTDLLVHRPDLELYPTGPKLGFGLWNLEVVEQAVEIGLIALAAVFWSAHRTRANQPAGPAAAFILLLLTVQIVAMLVPAHAAETLTGTAPMAIAVYLVITLAALPLDGKASLPDR